MVKRMLVVVAAVAVLAIAPGRMYAGEPVTGASDLQVQKFLTVKGTLAVMGNGTLAVLMNDGMSFVLEAPADAAEYALTWSVRRGWHIDKVRGSPRGKIRQAFTGEEFYEPEPLLELDGFVTVEYGMAGEPTLRVTVDGETETFDHTFMLVENRNPLRTDCEPIEGSGYTASGATCSVDCLAGSGSVTCAEHQGCYAYCSGRVPKVGCGERPSILY